MSDLACTCYLADGEHAVRAGVISACPMHGHPPLLERETETLVAWLTKILDGDEATARAALDLSKVHIPTSDGYEIRYYWMRELQLNGKMQGGWTMDAVFTPERARADIAAKRAIIAAEMDRVGAPHEFINEETAARIRGRADSRVLRALASAYADRPGYDESWKP